MPAIRFAGLSLIVVTGAAGMIGDASPSSAAWPSQYMHAAFGALLLSMILVSFRQGIAGGGLMDGAARALSRRLSRDLYLILYLMFGANLLVRAAVGAEVSTPPDNLRIYFTYGLGALLTIRALTAFSVRRPPARRMSPRLARAE